MGATTNSIDNFKTAPEEGDGLGIVVNATEAEGVAAIAEAHVHGPDCGHDHSHEAAGKMPVGKYLTPDQIPALNLKASFDLNNEGPVWRARPQDLLNNIAFRAASVPQGEVKICFVNNEAYKFLLAMRDFQKHFTPSATMEQQKAGVLGLFGTQVVIASDALWAPEDQLTLHKAIYFCDEVIDPSVTELLIETATKDGTGHESPPPADEIVEDVIDKKTGADFSEIE